MNRRPFEGILWMGDLMKVPPLHSKPLASLLGIIDLFNAFCGWGPTDYLPTSAYGAPLEDLLWI